MLPVKFATYINDSTECIGVISSDGSTMLPISSLGLSYNTMIDLIKNITKEEKQNLEQMLKKPYKDGIPMDEVQLIAAIPQPRDIIAVSQNYITHVKETCKTNGVEYKKPEYCCYFTRRVNRAVGTKGKICLHTNITSMMDYEVELAVVIGKECKGVSEKDAFDYIFGYTISNDITARDIQKNLPQYGYAKGLDDTTPIGPYIVTSDEIKNPNNLQLTTKVNGELRQNGNTNDLIFQIQYIVSDFSKGSTLYPGDIIITGTPSGIGASMNPPVFLKSGDVIACEIEGLGILENTVE